ncbi:hypothetical protein LTR95_012754 [Oleoguttula sp. CCFEE 5521]
MASGVVIIGVGDFVNRSRKIEEALEPLQLIINAIDKAVEDTGLSASSIADLKAAVDTLSVVRTWTWPYPDLPGLIAGKVGIQPRSRHYTEHGGNSPGVIFDEAARKISKGESKVAILTGGEALASLSACAAKGKLPPPGWTSIPESVDSVFSPTTRQLKPGALPGAWTPAPSDAPNADLGATHGIGNPIHIYPLYENAFRAHRGQSIRDNNSESAELYADFARVAAENPYAWNYGSPPQTAESISTPSIKNRMICLPYPLLMNAFNTVNLAGACILTSVEFAQELGIPKSKWVYALGGAGTRDSNEFWERPNYHSSPSISRSIDASLEISGLTKEDIDLYDFYSCFPIVPKLASTHLNLPILNPPKPITLLGGLTSFGGAGNNYSMHAITEMTRQLRAAKGKNGLILANGGVVTYQHVLCLSREPRKDGKAYPAANPLPAVVTDVAVPEIRAQAEGEAVVETYTVEFGRDGKPTKGFVVGRLVSSGERFLANHADERTLKALCSSTEEPIGKRGRVWTVEGKRNVFTFDEGAKL